LARNAPRLRCIATDRQRDVDVVGGQRCAAERVRDEDRAVLAAIGPARRRQREQGKRAHQKDTAPSALGGCGCVPMPTPTPTPTAIPAATAATTPHTHKRFAFGFATFGAATTATGAGEGAAVRIGAGDGLVSSTIAPWGGAWESAFSRSIAPSSSETSLIT